jgi:hypothetical protein
MQTRSTTEPIGYTIDSEIVGLFSFPEGASEVKMQMLIRVNGATILYGILLGSADNRYWIFSSSEVCSSE